MAILHYAESKKVGVNPILIYDIFNMAQSNINTQAKNIITPGSPSEAGDNQYFLTNSLVSVTV